MHRIAQCAAGAAATLLLAGTAPALAGPNCHLGNGIKHIVYLQFDNVHLKRDSPNVPSDLEQIPSLLNFLQDNGTLLSNHHTPLISHTSVDIVTSLTGVYGERFGFAVGNSFGFFDPSGNPHFTPSFAYWTDVVNEGTTATPINVPQMIDQRGLIHPAPWAPFTRAGCDVGGFSVANIEFERVPDDVTTFYGAGSAVDTTVRAQLASSSAATRQQPTTDYLGIAIHCGIGSPLCNNGYATNDPLPDEPNGYNGFKGLFGNVNVVALAGMSSA